MPMKKFLPFILVALILAAFPSAVFATGIVSGSEFAWGENIGWLNWGTPEGNVDVGTTELTGYVWGENVGWVSLNCSNTSSCGTVNYKVTRSGGTISGYAWGENVGWVSFSCANTASCGIVNYGVNLDTSTGIFSGYAWGENIGWISMNCSNTSSCGTVEYKVATTAATPTPTPTPGGGSSGGGFLPSPSPSISPTPTPSTSFSPTPTPSAVPVPSTLPPPVMPTAPPPYYVPPILGPITQFINRIGQGFDFLSEFLFGERLPPISIAAWLLLLFSLFWLFFFGLKKRRTVKEIHDLRTLFIVFYERLMNILFVIGIFLVPLNYIWYPTTLNLIILLLFILINGYRIWDEYRHSHHVSL